MRSACYLFIFSLTFYLTACSKPAEEYQREFFAMGTLISVQLYDVPQARAVATLDDIEADFQTMHRDWHAWEDGPLVHLNKALAEGEPFPIPDVLAPLIPPAIALAEQSDHLFNPALGRLFALWGFQGNARESLPDQSAIAALLEQQPRMTDLTIQDGILTSSNPAVQIDLGGFAKGWAVDRVIEKLRAAGIDNAIVNTGGDLRAIGTHGKRPWRIGIRHPENTGPVAALEIEGDAAVFTSGSYERYFELNGKRYHHILDPRSGWPAEGTVSLTVIHHNGATADAAATALFVAGDDWPRVAQRMNITRVLRIRSDGVAEITPALAGRIQWLEPRDSTPIIRGYNELND